MEEAEFEELTSELGEIELFNTFLRRIKNEDDRWEKIQAIFEQEELAEEIKFSEIEEMKFDLGHSFPNILFDLGEKEKRMFLGSEDETEDIFDRIKYRWKAYRQNNS